MDEKKDEKKKTTRKSTKSETVAKTATKKAAAKKTTTKKTDAKKTTTKKTATKKADTKKTEGTESTAKKTTAKKTTKKEPKKVAAEKSVETKKPVKKITKKSDLVAEEKIEEKIAVIDKSSTEEEYSFCSKCGRKLNSGETCDCESKKDINFNIDKEVIVNKSKSIFDIIFGVYKKPYEFCQDYTKSGDYKNSFILIAIISFTMGLLITALTYAAFHIDFLSGQVDSVGYDIPYFKVFIVWTIVSFIMSFIPIFITYFASSLFSNKKFNFDNSLNLYASTLSSVVLVNFVSAVFIFAGLFVKFFLLISFLAFIFAFINYIFVYRDIVLFEKDKESFIFLAIALVWIIGIVLISSIFASGINGLDISDTIATTFNK